MKYLYIFGISFNAGAAYHIGGPLFVFFVATASIIGVLLSHEIDRERLDAARERRSS